MNFVFKLSVIGTSTANDASRRLKSPTSSLTRAPNSSAGQARGHVDRAAVGVAAEQRALRAAQDLDALHLGEIHLLEAEAVLPHAVDVQADAGQAANVELRLGAARARIQHDVRHHDAEVAAVGDAAELELLRREA